MCCSYDFIKKKYIEKKLTPAEITNININLGKNKILCLVKIQRQKINYLQRHLCLQ